MPKKADANLKNNSGIYKSKIKASLAYDQNNVDNIRLRVPKGWKEQIQKYVQNNNNYNSVNDMICKLIQKEIGLAD